MNTREELAEKLGQLGSATSRHGHQVKILAAPEHGTLVYLDGVLVKELVNVELSHRVGDLCRVRLEFFPSELEVEGEVGVVVKADPPAAQVERVRNDTVARSFLGFAAMKKKAAEAAAAEVRFTEAPAAGEAVETIFDL